MNSDTLSIEQARAVVADAPRWKAMRVFLWEFASLIDRDRILAGLPKELSSTWLKPPYSAPLAQAILAREKVQAVPFYPFPAENGSRLLLCSTATFTQIALWLGTLLYTDHLRGIVAGAAVRSLRQQLPGVFPEALTFTAYFNRWATSFAAVRSALGDVPDKAEDWDKAIRLAGFRMLTSLLRSVPKSLLERQVLRFPVADEPGFEPFPAEVLSEAQLDLLFLLLKLRFPEANALCS